MFSNTKRLFSRRQSLVPNRFRRGSEIDTVGGAGNRPRAGALDFAGELSAPVP